MTSVLHVQIAAILIGLLFLSVSVNARVCRTFFISSYSFPLQHPSLHAGDHHLAAGHNPSRTITTFTEIRSMIPVYIVRGDNNNNKPSFAAAEIFIDRALPGQEIEEEFEIQRRDSQIRAPLGFSSHDFSSLRDRTKDILSVVVALLFGVGCGALTAATMYFVWSVFSNRNDYHAFDDYADDDHEDEIESPKKMGYVKIPAAESVPAPAKEAV